ncbi:hypothetical protein AB0H73_35020 [Streptomyces olivoreticuli]
MATRSKKDSVPSYQPQEPDDNEPSRNDILDRYGLGTKEGEADETDEEREMREWEEAQERKLNGETAGPSDGAPPPSQLPVTQPHGEVMGPGGGDEDDAPAVVNLPAHADRHGYVAMPSFTPPASEDPRERLDHYLQGIGQVEYAAKSNEQRVQQQRLLTLGEYIQAMKEERAWEVGGYQTLGDLLFEHFRIRKDYANKVVRAMPVVRALVSVTTMDLKERQLRVLVPVQKDHGDDAVRKVWEEASRRGKLTEKTLEQAAKFLGFGSPEPVDSKITESARRLLPAASAGSKPKVNGVPSGDSGGVGGPKRLAPEVFERIQALRSTNEEQARLEVKELRATLDELCRELGIDVPPAGG